ncbi:MAG: hypothetical protein AB7O59_14770 [Pirellulales bacterium]
MKNVIHRFLALTALAFALSALPAGAQDPPQEPPQPSDAPSADNLPTVKFFYFDAARVEWIVSGEAERFQSHLGVDPQSQSLFNAASAAVLSSPDSGSSAQQMTRWIEEERKRFEQSRREPSRIRMAEGIIAYLRDHDFSIPKLVESLKQRSGASAVELVAIHLRDRQGNPSYKLKVVLVNPQITVNRQGFNIDLPSPNANYTTATYALGVAMYEVQEIIHGTPTGGDAEEGNSLEQLPAPEPVDARSRASERRSQTAG